MWKLCKQNNYVEVTETIIENAGERNVYFLHCR
jgi:hypothetical protein